MKRYSLYFAAPQKVEVREESLPPPGDDQVMVRTLFSAISPGTEMLIYHGQAPEDMALDETIPSLQGSFRFPFKYGYSCVGEVVAVGKKVAGEWLGQRVFSFHPHESAFLAEPAELMPIPDGLALEDAVFLPNMETAVNFVLDGKPLLGEEAAVFGQGVIGLLTSALLVQFPLDRLAAFEKFRLRQEAAAQLGVKNIFDAPAPDAVDGLRAALFPGGAKTGFDLVFELSGSPSALDQAIHLTRFHGRVVIGSWYGSSPAQLNLGGSFHRSRIQLISSQVSTIGPDLSGRWDKARRFALAWRQLEVIRPSRWITHRLPFERAPEAYRLLAESPQETIQVILIHG